MSRFRRDFESESEYRIRIRADSQVDFEPVDLTETVLPSPWVVDQGPMLNTKADEAAIRREAQRIFELDQRDRLPR
jgi:hypothetical protein